jgi:hypothetical protein
MKKSALDQGRFFYGQWQALIKRQLYFYQISSIGILLIYNALIFNKFLKKYYIWDCI